MLLRNGFTHDTRVEKEARTLTDAGYVVTVVADAAPGTPDRETRSDGTRVIRVAKTAGGLPGLRYLRHELRLASVLRDLDPVLMHAHDSNALLPVAIAARRLRVPFIYDAHELWLHRPRRGRGWLYARLFELFYLLVHQWTIPRAAVTLTVSKPIAHHLTRSYGIKRIELVPNYPELTSDDEPCSLRSLAPGLLPPDVPILLHLGGMMADRGLEELVEAAAMRPEPHLVFLGAGEQWSDLTDLAGRRGIADRVHRLDPVRSDDVVRYAASATIGVVATSPNGLNNRYSLPNKLFQYMGAGIPVVASDFAQIRDVVEGSKCGYVVDTRQPRAIAEAIGRLLDDPVTAATMGARGRVAVAEYYNWSTSARALQDAYAFVAGPGHESGRG